MRVDGQLGKDGTIALVEDHFRWLSLKRDFSRIVSQCRTCQLAKGRKHNIGLYAPLSIPYSPWRDISMDFVHGLPRTSRAHDLILVMVDRFSKMAHFISCSKTNDVSHVAKLVCREIGNVHSMPVSTVSDRDVKFIC